MMEELRRFIPVGQHCGKKTGDLQKTLESIPVVKPQFTTNFREAVEREGADDVEKRMGKVCCAPSSTPRMWETTDGGHRSRMRTGMQLVRLFTKGVEVSGMGDHPLQVEFHKAVNLKKPGVSKNARALWLMRDAEWGATN